MPSSVSVVTETEYNALIHRLELAEAGITNIDLRLKKLEELIINWKK